MVTVKISENLAILLTNSGVDVDGMDSYNYEFIKQQFYAFLTTGAKEETGKEVSIIYLLFYYH